MTEGHTRTVEANSGRSIATSSVVRAVFDSILRIRWLRYGTKGRGE